ncbi:MAG: hypothetical protein E7618_04140 [Ruminococcaceae bacterium]|nr:hypothetical protein [Oscillospiraceae bacterium]
MVQKNFSKSLYENKPFRYTFVKLTVVLALILLLLAAISMPTEARIVEQNDIAEAQAAVVETGPIPSGVYSMQNTYSGMYLDVVRDAYYTGSYIQQYDFYDDPSTVSVSRLGLYKIQWISGNDYVIRTMINNANGFTPVSLTTGSYLRTAAVSTTNTNVSSAHLWTITRLSNGNYVISPKNNTSLAIGSQSQTSSGGGYTNTSSRLVLQSSSDSRAQWQFHLLDADISFHGAEVINMPNIPLLPGVSYDFDAYMYSSDLAQNGPVQYAVSDPVEGIEGCATVYRTSGYLTVESSGVIELKLLYGTGTNDYVGVLLHLPAAFEGLYYITCYDDAGYVDVSNSAGAGEVLECNELGDSSRHIWIVLYQNNGYYAIRNYVTGYYLTSVNGEAKQTAKGSSFTSSQLWKFEKQDDGSLKLFCKSNTSTCLTHQDANHEAEDPDILVSSDGLGTRQKWFFVPYYDEEDGDTYLINVNTLYDNAYSQQVTIPQSWIGQQIITAQGVFAAQFGIMINNTSIANHPSYADGSSCSADFEEACIHGTCENSKLVNGQPILKFTHHRNITNSLLRLPLPNRAELYKILFFGHYPCMIITTDYGDGVVSSHHTLKPNELSNGQVRDLAGVAILNAGVIGIAYPPGDRPEEQLMEACVLVHELGHLFGAPDHPTASATNTLNSQYYIGKFEANCIYGPNRDNENVYMNFIICPGCRAQILQGREENSHA